MIKRILGKRTSPVVNIERRVSAGKRALTSVSAWFYPLDEVPSTAVTEATELRAWVAF